MTINLKSQIRYDDYQIAAYEKEKDVTQVAFWHLGMGARAVPFLCFMLTATAATQCIQELMSTY